MPRPDFPRTFPEFVQAQPDGEVMDQQHYCETCCKLRWFNYDNDPPTCFTCRTQLAPEGK